MFCWGKVGLSVNHQVLSMVKNRNKLTAKLLWSIFKVFLKSQYLKIDSAFFLFLHQTIALKKLWKMIFLSSEKLFSVPQYSVFCIFLFPSSVSHCWRRWLKKGVHVYVIISWLNKKLKTFAWYLEKESRSDFETSSVYWVLNEEYFTRKECMRNMCTKS